MFIFIMTSHNRRKELSLHLSIAANLLLSIWLVLQVETEFVQNHTVHAFMATTTTTSTHSRRIHISSSSSQQRQLQEGRLQTLKLFLSSASSSDPSNKKNDSVRQPPNQPQQQQPQKQQQQRVLSNQQGKREMFNSIMAQPPTYIEGDTVMDINNNIIPIIDDSTDALINCIVMAADGRKADNIVALYVAHMTTMTSVLVVVSGNSRPQNQAICAAIRTAVSDINTQPSTDDNTNQSYYPQPSIEGTAESGWMILDYGSVMVHVMTPKSRLFYNVEGKWKQPQPMMSSATTTTATTTVMTTAIPLDLSHLLVPNSATITSNMLQQQQQQQRSMDPMDYESDDDDMIPNQNMEKDFETYDTVEDEKGEEEELDPFWS